MVAEGESASRRSGWSFGPRGAGPLLLAVPALSWWMAQVGLHTLGTINTGKFGYPAWLEAVSTFPEWPLQVLAYTGVPFVVTALLVVGGVLTLHGVRAVPAILLVFVSSTVVSAVLVFLAARVWADPGLLIRSEKAIPLTLVVVVVLGLVGALLIAIGVKVGPNAQS